MENEQRLQKANSSASLSTIPPYRSVCVRTAELRAIHSTACKMHMDVWGDLGISQVKEAKVNICEAHISLSFEARQKLLLFGFTLHGLNPRPFLATEIPL